MGIQVADVVDVRARIAGLKFDVINERLITRRGWTMEQCRDVGAKYRQFLLSAATGGDLHPTPEVDEFWHQHILDTVKYARDCSYALGFFLHHDPRSGRDFSVGLRLQPD